jgi:hypothetical protein
LATQKKTVLSCFCHTLPIETAPALVARSQMKLHQQDPSLQKHDFSAEIRKKFPDYGNRMQHIIA